MNRNLGVGLLFLILSNTASATCLSILGNNESLGALNSTQTACLANDAGAKGALSDLCSSNEDNISQKYSFYLKGKADYQKALTELKTAQNQSDKLQASADLTDAETEWVAAGYKYEIQAAIGALKSTLANCH